jgi:hypothetical protein
MSILRHFGVKDYFLQLFKKSIDRETTIDVVKVIALLMANIHLEEGRICKV